VASNDDFVVTATLKNMYAHWQSEKLFSNMFLSKGKKKKALGFQCYKNDIYVFKKITFDNSKCSLVFGFCRNLTMPDLADGLFFVWHVCCQLGDQMSL
jgi:hypothetical protein